VPNPIDNEELFDAILVGNDRSPGQVTVSGHDRNFKFDVKDADGAGGAHAQYKGEQLAQFTTSFYLVKDPTLGVDEFEEWETFAAILRAALPKGGQAKALPIYHPDLAANDIKKASPQSIGGLVHDGKGGANVAVKWIEYRPPKKASALPTKPTPATPPDPNADLKAQIDQLLKEAQTP